MMQRDQKRAEETERDNAMVREVLQKAAEDQAHPLAQRLKDHAGKKRSFDAGGKAEKLPVSGRVRDALKKPKK